MQIEDKLNLLGVKEKNYLDADVMCLPENIYSEAEIEKLLEPADQIWLIKMLREKGLKVFTLYDVQLDIASLERRGDDKWYGHIVIDKIAIPILVGIIAGVSAVKISEIDKKQIPQKSKVNINLLVKDKEKETHLDFEGDDKTLIKILEVLSAEEEM